MTSINHSPEQVPKDAGSPSTALAAHTVQNISWSMELGNGEGVAPFVLTTGDDVFDDRMRLFGSVRPVCFSAASLLLHSSSL